MSEEIKKTEDTEDTEEEITIDAKEHNYIFNQSKKGIEYNNVSGDAYKKTTTIFHGFSKDWLLNTKYQSNALIALPNRKAFGDKEKAITIYIDLAGTAYSDILAGFANEIKTRGTQKADKGLSEKQKEQIKKGYFVISAKEFFEDKLTITKRGARPKFEDLSNADKAIKIKASGLTKAELLAMIQDME